MKEPNAVYVVEVRHNAVGGVIGPTTRGILKTLLQKSLQAAPWLGTFTVEVKDVTVKPKEGA